MTNNQLLILATVLVLIYLYWKYQANKSLPLKPEDIIERQDKPKEQSIDDFSKSSEVFFDAEDFDLDSAENNHD